MSNLLGTCYVGRHVKGDPFVLLKFAFDGKLGVHFLIGPAVPVSSPVMETDGLSIVLNQLRNIPFLDPKKLSESEQIPDKELLKIKRDHVLASISLLESNTQEMKMIPLHAGKGWRFNRRAEEVRLFALPTSNGEFMERLNEALNLAS